MVLAQRLGVPIGRFGPYLIPLVCSALLATLAVGGILQQAGRPALPLDDSFIHLQFARRLAEGHPFTFTTDGNFSSGATSFLWPLLLAPFYWLGCQEFSLIYVVWAIGTLLHAGVAVEMGRLVRPIVGDPSAIAAQMMCLGFGAFAWFAWSGMETLGLTWAMLRAFRQASDVLAAPDKPSRSLAVSLGFIAGVAALFRPEGAIAALVACAVVLLRGSHQKPSAAQKTTLAKHPISVAVLERLPAILPLGIAALPALLNWILVGHARSTTAMVKWLLLNPYYSESQLLAAFTNNASMLVTSLIGGGPYTAVFLPEGAHVIFYAGFACLLALLVGKEHRLRAVLLLAYVAASLAPASYETMLWNRVRYIWPFAPAWFAMVCILGKTLANLSARRFAHSDAVALLIPAMFAGGLITKLPWSLSDLATSARAIDQQQVKLGLWAREHLPNDARIGVNDTGAIAYLSERTTFDVVGLTTESEAQYWVAGAGSRYEHYEKLGPARLPSHFIVYREWFGCPSLLGEELFSATVTDQSILGGATKTVYAADYSVFGRAERPLSQPFATLIDEVDVSDLESEAAHAFWLGSTHSQENLAFSDFVERQGSVTDGGRNNRSEDRMVLKGSGSSSLRLVARFVVEEPTTLTVLIDNASVGQLLASPGGFSEASLPIGVSDGPMSVTVRAADARFASLHYWLVTDAPAVASHPDAPAAAP